jgi:hypothetical protein
MNESFEDNRVRSGRSLKPSYLLQLVVGLCVLIASLFAAIFSARLGLALFLCGLIGICPLLAVPAISEAICKIAESRGAQPGSWFDADIKREKSRFGPLRAYRLFGHPIGRGSKSSRPPPK